MIARVLVIEDDANVAVGIRTVVTRSGCNVTGSADGLEGLRVFHAGHPDLVVDIGLPPLDGCQVLERIPYMSDVPILMLTAQAGKPRSRSERRSQRLPNQAVRQQRACRARARAVAAPAVGAGGV